MVSLDGKYAAVTGGTQGLGAAVARRFAAAEVAGLVTCGRSTDKGAAVAARITEETGCPVHFVTADLGRVADCRTVIATAERHFGRLDVLVNAAAITDRGTILDTSEDLFDRIRLEGGMFAELLRSEEFAEAATAFMERRAPDFAKYATEVRSPRRRQASTRWQTVGTRWAARSTLVSTIRQ